MASAQKNTNYVAGWMGVLAIAFVVAAFIMSAALTGWTLGVDSISKLGTGNEEYAIIFNIGVFAAGLLLVAYGGARAASEKGYFVLGSALLAVGGIFIAFYAVFDFTGNVDIHRVCALLAAVFLGASLIDNAYQLNAEGGAYRIIAGIGTAMAMIALIAGITCNLAVAETICFFAVIIWMTFDVAAYLASGINAKQVN